MHESTKLENSTFNIMTALDKEAMFLFSTAETHISDVEKDNRQHLVEIWNNTSVMKIGRRQMLREDLAREVNGEKFRQ